MGAGLRDDYPFSGGSDTSKAFAGLPVPPVIDGQDPEVVALARLASNIAAARRKLGTHLEASLFANPGLDIMLFLFAEGINGATVTTNACCAAAGVPRTTALRWIKLLQDRGLVDGSDDVSDRRVTMLALSPQGRATIRTWLGEIAALPLRGIDQR
jgi:DNA-binding MarR family transcriptional regulator